jgi:predicted transcriptional regulator of viral defense system
MKYIQLVRQNFVKQPVFSITELRRFLAKKGISNSYSALLVHNLLQKGEISRIAKGVYSFQKDILVSGFAFSPFYYGLQEALSLRNLWEQETNPVIITPKKFKPGLRQIMGANVLVRRINRKMFFGFDFIKYYNMWIPVSDAEKTLIDFFYFKEDLPSDAILEIKEKIDEKKLRAYLQRVSPKLAKKVKEKLVKTK